MYSTDFSVSNTILLCLDSSPRSALSQSRQNFDLAGDGRFTDAFLGGTFAVDAESGVSWFFSTEDAPEACGAGGGFAAAAECDFESMRGRSPLVAAARVCLMLREGGEEPRPWSVAA